MEESHEADWRAASKGLTAHASEAGPVRTAQIEGSIDLASASFRTEWTSTGQVSENAHSGTMVRLVAETRRCRALTGMRSGRLRIPRQNGSSRQTDVLLDAAHWLDDRCRGRSFGG